jgi:hypothetical protein
MPPRSYDDRIGWAGEYQSGYQHWCAWQGKDLVCERQNSDES